MSQFSIKTQEGLEYNLDRDLIRVGRSAENDIVLKNSTVSRFHLNIHLQEQSVIVEDAGSAKGFKINDIDADSSAFITPGDVIQIGDTYLKLGSEGNYKKTHKLNLSSRVSMGEHDLSSSHLKIANNKNTFRGVLIVLVVVVFGFGFISQNNNESATKLKTNSKSSIALSPISTEGYLGEDTQIKSPTEITAIGKFREAKRDYYDGNYVRAITGFETALSWDPSLNQARVYTEFAKQSLEKRTRLLIKDAEKSYRLGQFKRSSFQSREALNIFAEQVPGYLKKIFNDKKRLRNLAQNDNERSLLIIPCENTQEPIKCEKAQKLFELSLKKLKYEERLLQ